MNVKLGINQFVIQIEALLMQRVCTRHRSGFCELCTAKREFYFCLLCYLRKSLEELKTTKQQEIEVNKYISVIISCT